MNSTATRYKRRTVLSNPRVQVKIITIFGFMALLYAGTNYYVASGTLRSAAAEIDRLQLSDVTRQDVRMVIRQQNATLDWQMALFTFLSFFTLTMAGVMLSHRLGGPMYQLNTYLKGLVDGSVKPRIIRFRKHDFFHELAETFNRFQRSRGILPPPESSDAKRDSGDS